MRFLYERGRPSQQARDRGVFTGQRIFGGSSWAVSALRYTPASAVPLPGRDGGKTRRFGPPGPRVT